MRTCPYCNNNFAKARIRKKVKHCPKCNNEIFYIKKKTVKRDEYELNERIKSAARIFVEKFEEHRSQIAGVPFYFQGITRAKALSVSQKLSRKVMTYIDNAGGDMDFERVMLRMLVIFFMDKRYAFATDAMSISVMSGKLFMPIVSEAYRLIVKETTRVKADIARYETTEQFDMPEGVYAVL